MIEFKNSFFLSQMSLLSMLSPSWNTVWAGGFEIKAGAESLGVSHANRVSQIGNVEYMTYNPGGLAFLTKNQTTFSATALYPRIKYQNTGVAQSGINTVLNDATSTKSVLVPAVFLGLSASNKVKFGVAVTVPFGLEISNPTHFAGRYWALQSRLQTLNIAALAALKINDQWGLGFGPQFQSMDVRLTRALNTTALLDGANQRAAAGNATTLIGLRMLANANHLAPTGDTDNDINAQFKANRWGVGGLFGITFKPRPGTQFGLSYRTLVNHGLKGTRSFSISAYTQDNLNGFAATSPGAAAIVKALKANIANSNIKSNLKTPHAVNLGLSHQLNQEWQLLGELNWTHWSVVQEVRVSPQGLIGGTPDVVPFKWKDTLAGSLGVHYRPQNRQRTTFKFGVAYDPTPVPDQYRYPTLPDNDRLWISGGIGYETQSTIKLSLNYAHEFVKKAKINLQPQAGTVDYTKGNLKGIYKSSVDIVSAHINYRF